MKKIAEERTSVTLNSEGLTLFGVLHMPQNRADNSVPAVLFCHGFGGNKSGKYRLAVRLAERLSQAGIASLRIDCRGSGDSEGDFADTTIDSQLKDIETALTYLKSNPQIDTQRIGLMGRSLGGALATHVAHRHGELKSLALWCPLFDAKPWLEKRANGTREFHFLGQRLGEEFIEQFAALNTARAMATLESTPMLIIKAGRDEVLTSYHYEQYLAHRKNCPTTKTQELAHSSHDFSNREEQEVLLELTTQFLRDTL